MRRYFQGVLAVGLLAVVGPATAAAPFAGTWAVTILTGNQELTVWVVRIEDKDGKPEVSVVTGLEQYKAAKVLGVSADATSVRFTLRVRGTDYRVRAYAADKGKNLLGSVRHNEQVEAVTLEPSEWTELDPRKAARTPAGFDELKKALAEEGDKEKRAALTAVITKHPDQAVALLAARMLAQEEIGSNEKSADVKAAAERWIRSAGAYGPELRDDIIFQVARMLSSADKEPALVLEYARKAASLIQDTDSAARTAAVLKVLAGALRKAGKADELKEVNARLAKLDEVLDKEWLQNSVPFRPDPYGGRRGKSDRVVLVELFTGAQCPPCVAADVAFDAALQAYKPKDVVFLQYHLHVPGPDPLTNAGSEAREKYYGDAIEGTPTLFIDGKPTPGLGGPRAAGKVRFGKLSKLLNDALETDASAQLKLTVDRRGDKLDLAADVSGLKKVGDKVRLRFVLVEDLVRYPGSNGQRFHHHVVRGFPGGAAGMALKDKATNTTAIVSLAEVRKSLQDYLDASNKDNPFPDDNRPLKLENLKVVAFIQDDESKEILQAAQADVPAAK